MWFIQFSPRGALVGHYSLPALDSQSDTRVFFFGGFLLPSMGAFTVTSGTDPDELIEVSVVPLGRWEHATCALCALDK